jgi:dihydrofolate synthase / folylpolyglutamate synthase
VPTTLAWDHSIVAGHRIPLAGSHQVENLATAWEALRRLGVDEARAWQGIEATVWPGRLWPVPGLPGVTLDGAHNLDGTRRLAEHARATGVRPHLYFSAMGDKDLAGMRDQLLRMNPASITLVRGENPRYATAQDLRDQWGEACEVLDIATAAARLRTPQAGERLVCGSLYFIGDLLQALGIKPA